MRVELYIMMLLGAVTYTLPAVNATADSGIAGPGPSLDNLSNVGATFTIVDSITKTGDLVVRLRIQLTL